MCVYVTEIQSVPVCVSVGVLSSVGCWKRKKKAPDLRRDFLIFLSLKWKCTALPTHSLPKKTHACTLSESPKGKAKALFWVHWCSLSPTYLYDVIHTQGTEPWLATYIVTWRTLTMSLSSHFQVDIYDAAQVMTQWGDCIAKSYS